ncbi:hypothetical protein EJ08DRAFT_665362 [Tothia fuscella]|uniref:Uncharacterized protein n=1 Tax=Tothia fuscella TaxID=1048955 RepID=A0A9P4NGQ3_9PEZI|nr:hypothetical protein EJ08DRAFT_665362 [Tothia fuscella]
MHYISTLALAILTAATLTSAITPDSVISTLNSLEARTGTLETLASSLNTASCITGGPYIDILEGLDTMTTKIKSLNQNLDGSEPLKSNVADAQFANEIMSGYHEFVKAQAAFLKNLSGKAKVCKTLMLGGQMVPFLEGARTVLDSIH